MSTLEAILNLIDESEEAAQIWINATKEPRNPFTQRIYQYWSNEWLRREYRLAAFPGDWLLAAYRIKELRLTKICLGPGETETE